MDSYEGMPGDRETVSGSEVSLGWQGISVPEVCACCLSKTSDSERIRVPLSVRGSAGLPVPRRMSVYMPLCPACRGHRRAFFRRVRWIGAVSVLMGLAVMLVLLEGLGKGAAVSAAAGCGTMIAFRWALMRLVHVPSLSTNHASRFATVRVTADVRHPDRFLDGPRLSFVFANDDYAHLFAQVNPTAGEVCSRPRDGTTAGQSVHWVNRGRRGGYARAIAVFAVCACLLTAASHAGLLTWTGLRERASAVVPVVSEWLEQMRATPVPTATPRPTAVPTPTPTPTPTPRPTATPTPTPKPTATPSPRPTVSVINGRVFVLPDYEQVCPLTVEAGSGANYYVYLEYVGKPYRTDDDRSVKSTAYAPYESDLAFFVKSGKSAKVDVPVGNYRFYYATGDDFYGTRDLFGEKTRTYEADELFAFYTERELNGTRMIGHTVTLRLVENGNLETDPIPEDKFPKR